MPYRHSLNHLRTEGALTETCWVKNILPSIEQVPKEAELGRLEKRESWGLLAVRLKTLGLRPSGSAHRGQRKKSTYGRRGMKGRCSSRQLDRCCLWASEWQVLARASAQAC